MNFYHICWLAIFITGGICLALLGFINSEHFSLLIANPIAIDRVFSRLEGIYLKSQNAPQYAYAYSTLQN